MTVVCCSVRLRGGSELGTTIGLVLAHGFASWVTTRIIGDASEEVDSWDLLRVQLGGAVAVASLAMVAVVIATTSVELSAARFTVAATIAAPGVPREPHPQHGDTGRGCMASPLCSPGRSSPP